jgi:hypothetical protein
MELRSFNYKFFSLEYSKYSFFTHFDKNWNICVFKLHSGSVAVLLMLIHIFRLFSFYNP